MHIERDKVRLIQCICQRHGFQSLPKQDTEIARLHHQRIPGGLACARHGKRDYATYSDGSVVHNVIFVVFGMLKGMVHSNYTSVSFPCKQPMDKV